MKLKELISELKKHESEFGDSEVVTYYSLPMKNPPRKQGSIIMVLHPKFGLPQMDISWENGI